MPLVLVSGALANKPFNGGNAWTRLSWILGFQQLGFDVCFVEEISPQSCVDAAGNTTRFEQSVNLAYFAATMARFGLAPSAALLCGQGEKIYGLSLAALRAKAREALLLFNLSGHLTHPELKSLPACRLYYDDDPGFTQFWHAAGASGARLAGHDYYFTIGENIGTPDCPIPTDSIAWRHTRTPVVLQDWPVAEPRPAAPFTTVASWRGAYGPVQHAGKTYGLKVHEFRKFIRLPQLCSPTFEIALQIHPADQKDRDALLAHRWQIADPKQAAASPDSFRHYVQQSAAEFSVAQGIYVDTNSGWFSDRTVRYLASGKPALVQDTGFSRHLPVGQGLLAFRTLEQAVAGVEQITRDYSAHCRAARRVAESCFDSNHVIRQLLTEIGMT